MVFIFVPLSFSDAIIHLSLFSFFAFRLSFHEIDSFDRLDMNVSYTLSFLYALFSLTEKVLGTIKFGGCCKW